jgi:hypothetical protein
LEKFLISVLTIYALFVILLDFGRLSPWKEHVATYNAAKELSSHEGADRESRSWRRHAFDSWYPLGTLGFEANNDGLITHVSNKIITYKEDGHEGILKVQEDSPAKKASLQPGDVIDLAQTERTYRRASNQFVFVKFGEPVTLHMKPRLRDDGAAELPARTITLEPAPEPWSPLGTVGLLAAQVSAVVFILLSVWLVWHRPAFQTWGLFLYSLWFNSGQYFTWYANLSETGLLAFNYLQAFFEALGLAGILLFAMYFPQKPDDDAKKYAWCLLIVPFALLLAVRVWTLRGYVDGVPSENAFFVWYFLTLIVFITMGSLLLANFMMQPVNRPQIRMVGLGAMVGLAFWLIADTRETIGFPERLPIGWVDLFYSLSALLPLAIYAAIRQFRVIDVRFAISRGFFVIITAAIVVAVLHPTMHEFLVSGFPWLEEWWLPFGMALSIGLILLESRLHHWIERVMFPRWRRVVRKFREIAQELAHTGDYQEHEVHARVLQFPVDALQLKCGAVYKRTQDGLFALERSYSVRILCQECHQIAPSRLEPLAGDAPVFQWIVKQCETRRRRRGLVPSRRRSGDVGKPSNETASYTTAAHAVPVLRWHDQKRVVDRVVVFGPHVMDQDLDRDEIKLIDKLAMAAGPAYIAAEYQAREEADDAAPV